MSSDRPGQANEHAERLPDIAGYTVLRAIGHGGMSTVYLAEQTALGREVAVKVMLPEALADEVSRRRFENEVRTIARLEHPHIVGIFEVGRSRDGLPYYAMPHLSHGHLGQRDLTQDEPRVIAVLRALLSALDYAHARGVIHRDVKAENVLFDEADRPLLADFGIALRHGYSPRVTMAGLVMGSTAYMAPEQARGENVDHRADLYSVGVLAYEMLAGRLPYVADDALAMAMQHVQDPIPKLPRDKRHWQRFIDKAMAKSPGPRYRNAQQMLDAVQRIEQRRQSAGFALVRRIGDGVAPVRQWPRSVWIATGLAVAALAGIGLRHFNPAGDAPPAPTVTVAPSSAPTPTAAPAPADLTSAMLRPPPESPAEPLVHAAEQQIRAQNLTAPEGGNAYDSLRAAWRADPGHARLPATVDALIDAMATQIRQRLGRGDIARARDYIQHSEQLAQLTRRRDSPALRRLRDSAAEALDARVTAAARRNDRSSAIAAANLAAEVMDAPAASALMTRARAIGQSGARAATAVAGLVPVRSDGRIVGVGRHQVSRADYARFAAATGRPPALCRERASLLRLLAPRDWKAPGFAQAADQPVVCVSWSDADAYLRWLGRQSGEGYRLPRASEVARFTADGARPVAEWLADCSDACRLRQTLGRSWRGASGTRPLDPGRGYDDVGFRVVRDP